MGVDLTVGHWSQTLFSVYLFSHCNLNETRTLRGFNQLHWSSCQVSPPEGVCLTLSPGFLYLLPLTELCPAVLSTFVMSLLGSLDLDFVMILILEVQWCFEFWEEKYSMLPKNLQTEFSGVPACDLQKEAWKYLLNVCLGVWNLS